jgi:cytochrome c oxidase cbb3-type subunit 3
MQMRALVWCIVSTLPVFAQKPPARTTTVTFDPAVVERGHTEFKSSCGFCHGDDATGNRAPDLIRSPLVNHDENGSLLDPMIRNGRPDKGMPGFSNLPASQIADIVTFLHKQAFEALHSAHVSRDYPLAKLLTGNVALGKTYFDANCASCHSVTGDLAGIAGKYQPVDLQQRLVYPIDGDKRTATVTLPDGRKMEGALRPRGQVQVEVHDPLAGHRALTEKYTDADIHNVFAYLESLH